MSYRGACAPRHGRIKVGSQSEAKPQYGGRVLANGTLLSGLRDRHMRVEGRSLDCRSNRVSEFDCFIGDRFCCTSVCSISHVESFELESDEKNLIAQWIHRPSHRTRSICNHRSSYRTCPSHPFTKVPGRTTWPVPTPVLSSAGGAPSSPLLRGNSKSWLSHLVQIQLQLQLPIARNKL